MKNELSIYASKKLKTYIGKQLSAEGSGGSLSDVNEFYQWYGDVFFYQRKKFLIFSNELTRFVFAVGPYTVNVKKPIFNLFKEGLGVALKAYGLDTEAYFSHLDTLVINSKPHPGATAHLNTAKGDYLYSMAYQGNVTNPAVVAVDFNYHVNDMPVSRKGQKGYIYSVEEFKRNLDLLAE